jgi:uncharacterized surface protein with fasciclin (FAS1) repeats
MVAFSPMSVLHAQNAAETPVVPSPPVNPAVPETGVGGANPVDLNPKIPQAEAIKASAEVPDTSLVVADIVAGSENFTTLNGALKAAGLTDALKGKGPFTLLAPDNDAFEALPKGVLTMLLKPENRITLRKILAYHVIPSEFMSNALKPGTVDTVEGEPLVFVGKAEGVVVVQGAEFGQTDVKAQNGVIHVVKSVLIPPSVILDSVK